MQFKNPEILFALALLLIPIIIHLFQLRRFQKTPFTNVEFLKKVTIQTRKSQQLKKWLTLLTRLLMFACIILAFAQPFTSKTDGVGKENETVIYLDNSFSMQAKGDKGELLKRALQDLIANVDDTEEITLFTNDYVFRNTTLKAVKNELLQVDYSSFQLDYSAAYLKAKNLLSNRSETLKNIVLISDFQNSYPLNEERDSTSQIYCVQLSPVSRNNVSIDSAYISKTTGNNLELNVLVNGENINGQTIPISMYNGDELISKSAIEVNNGSSASFSIPNGEIFNGRLTVDDGMLQFDNSLYFNLNEPSKTNVLLINNADDDYLKRVYSEDEFNVTSVVLNQLNYNVINDQNLIVLNELESIPQALINAMVSFETEGGNIVIIPSSTLDLGSYNQLLSRLTNITFNQAVDVEKRITKINYSHPLFEGVFDKQVSNFQYPKVNEYITVNTINSPILEYEDGQPFLARSKNTFVFTAALNEINSNVINSPLIVPTLYNIGKQSFKVPELYYIVGEETSFDLNTTLQQDNILKLKKGDIELIPQQRTLTNKVVVMTEDVPTEAGIYSVIANDEILENVSYNYTRNESILTYHSLENEDGINLLSSVPDVINSIKSVTKVNDLWKWFAIFALVFLIIEMLILKYIR